VRRAGRIWRYLWVAPVSLVGGLLALLARLTGGGVTRHTGVLEAWGGGPGWALHRLVPGLPIAAITLGHVVLATGPGELERTRSHERVHVRQFERWGALFPLLYLGASGVALLRGRDFYADNVFEVEARRLE
jgi:hypothetical protein